VDQVAERLAEHHALSFLRRLAPKLLELATREERQDRVEAGAAKRTQR
jgi:hypothetical protein